jgi:hypothetical protein
METQNYKNHARVVPLFHMVTFGICLAVLVLSCILFFREMNIESTLYLLIAIVLLLSFYFIRLFPLKAQDRAIRAEENLRYFTLTGKLFDNKISMAQVIALRFASDNELVSLTERALNENMSSKDIKMAIKSWRADNYRA